MINHVMIETNEDTYDFYNVQDFRFDKESNSYLLLSQNNDFHTFARENIKQIVI